MKEQAEISSERWSGNKKAVESVENQRHGHVTLWTTIKTDVNSSFKAEVLRFGDNHQGCDNETRIIARTQKRRETAELSHLRRSGRAQHGRLQVKPRGAHNQPQERPHRDFGKTGSKRLQRSR